jgi:hypothetical protein
VNLRTKLVGTLGAAVMLLGVAAPAFADSPTNQRTETYEITQGSTFSATIDSGTNFTSKQFTLGDSSPQYSASYYYTVTDLRGTGAGWTLKASTPGFYTTGDSPVQVPNVQLHSSNLTRYLYGTTGDFTSDTGSVTTGVQGLSNWTSILAPGGVLMTGTAGLSGVTPNATGTFHSGDALFLTFPNAVAAGTYQSTITLTLSSNQP